MTNDLRALREKRFITNICYTKQIPVKICTVLRELFKVATTLDCKVSNDGWWVEVSQTA